MSSPAPELLSSLIDDTSSATSDPRVVRRLEHVRRSLHGPLRVAVAGAVSAGKSTLVNALVGRLVAPTDAGECTRIPTAYRRGPVVAARALLREPNAPPAELEVSDDDGRLRVGLGGLPPDDIALLDVTVPGDALEGLVLIDTPGLGSRTPGTAQRTTDLLAGRRGLPRPEALLVVLRPLGRPDDDVLETLRDPRADGVAGLDSLAILSRADEAGGGSGCGIEVAREVARSWTARMRDRRLAPLVVPLCGVVAEVATTLSEEEYDDLCVLAAMVPSATDSLLLSADRFGSTLGCPVPPERRGALMRRLSLAGLRWALLILRTPDERGLRPPALPVLRRELDDVSGMRDLRLVLRGRVTGRRDLLKADAVLREVERALDTVTDAVVAEALGARVEHLRLQAAGFGERELLEHLMGRTLELSDELAARMERQLTTDLGDAATIRRLHTEWAALAADPLSSPDLSRAADVLMRRCEQGLVGQRAAPPRRR